MWKINFRKLSFAIVVLTILTIYLYVQPSASQTTYNWKWSPNVQFRLPAYNTIIAFNDYIYIDSFSWDSMNASAVTFNNINYKGETASALAITAETSQLTITNPTHNVTIAHPSQVHIDTLTLLNMTTPQLTMTDTRYTGETATVTVKNADLNVTNLLHNKQFIGELNGLTGTVAELAITHSLYTSMPGTVAVDGIPLTTPCATKAEFDSYGGNTWYYDTTTNTVYIKAVLHSPTSIYVDWNTAPAPAPAPTPTPTPTPTPQPTITPTPTIPTWTPVLIIALIIIALLIAKKRH
jgi:hypothetical protein